MGFLSFVNICKHGHPQEFFKGGNILGFSIRGGGGRQRGPKNPTKPTIKMPLEERYNFSHCKIEIDLSCSDSYTLELSLLALKAANSCL